MTVGCIGAGSWGTTLSVYLAQQGHHVLLLPYSAEQYRAMRSDRENRRYLPGIPFPESLDVVDDVRLTSQADCLVVATPTQYIRGVVTPLSSSIPSGTLIVNTSKGIERGTLQRVSQILQEVTGAVPEQIVSLSGPSHAEEVSRNDPAAPIACPAAVRA